MFSVCVFCLHVKANRIYDSTTALYHKQLSRTVAPPHKQWKVSRGKEAPAAAKAAARAPKKKEKTLFVKAQKDQQQQKKIKRTTPTTTHWAQTLSIMDTFFSPHFFLLLNLIHFAWFCPHRLECGRPKSRLTKMKNSGDRIKYFICCKRNCRVHDVIIYYKQQQQHEKYVSLWLYYNWETRTILT